MPSEFLSGGFSFLHPYPPTPFPSLYHQSHCGFPPLRSDQTPSYSQGGFGEHPPQKRPMRRDDKVHDSLIEERIGRERPCRTLFIRNIKVNFPLEKSEPNRGLRFPLQGVSFLRNETDRQFRNAHSTKHTVRMFAECLKSMERSKPFSILSPIGAWYL